MCNKNYGHILWPLKSYLYYAATLIFSLSNLSLSHAHTHATRTDVNLLLWPTSTTMAGAPLTKMPLIFLKKMHN
jgi:hypothetical protein